MVRVCSSHTGFASLRIRVLMHNITSTCLTHRRNRGIKETMEHRAISQAGCQTLPWPVQLLGSVTPDVAIISFQLPQPRGWLKPPRQHPQQRQGSWPTAAPAALPYGQQAARQGLAPPLSARCAPYVGLCAPGAGAAAQDAEAARLLHTAGVVTPAKWHSEPGYCCCPLPQDTHTPLGLAAWETGQRSRNL